MGTREDSPLRGHGRTRGPEAKGIRWPTGLLPSVDKPTIGDNLPADGCLKKKDLGSPLCLQVSNELHLLDLAANGELGTGLPTDNLFSLSLLSTFHLPPGAPIKEPESNPM